MHVSDAYNRNSENSYKVSAIFVCIWL